METRTNTWVEVANSLVRLTTRKPGGGVRTRVPGQTHTRHAGVTGQKCCHMKNGKGDMGVTSWYLLSLRKQCVSITITVTLGIVSLGLSRCHCPRAVHCLIDHSRRIWIHSVITSSFRGYQNTGL